MLGDYPLNHLGSVGPHDRPMMRDCPLCGMPCKLRGGGYTHHMKWHVKNGDIQLDDKDCNTGKTSVIIPTEEIGGDFLDAALHKVYADGAAAIQLAHPKLFKKRRIAKQVLFITHGETFGDPRAIVFGLAGGGCEALRLDDLKITPLIRAGLPADLAGEIVKRLRVLNSERQQS